MMGTFLSPSLHRKRLRDECNDEPQAMDLDRYRGHLAGLRGVNSLSKEELEVARSLARDRLFRLLYLQLDDEPVEEASDPMISSTEMSPDRPSKFVFTQETTVCVGGGIAIPSTLYYVAEWILMHARDPTVFFDVNVRDGTRGVGDVVGGEGPHAFLKNFPVARKAEVACCLLNFLRSRPALLHARFHQAFKSVLSMNNASGGKILPGSMIPTPNDFIVKLLRDIIISITVESRHILQYLLSFLCTLSYSPNFKDRMTMSRRLSIVFGPILIGSPVSTTASSVAKHVEWSFALCEILLQAHGLALTNDSLSLDEARFCKTLLWKLNDSFECQIVARTPKKSAVLTPRRGMAGKGVRKVGSSATRLLFRPAKAPLENAEPREDLTYSPHSPQSPVSPNYVVGDGSRFTSCLSPLAVERDFYRKRLRLE
ncbi:hypothetical protein HDU67_003104 [Dinochytrium kinnereticum]|nr:hypothetical protein HDU67_003104 [Dinochytrium kinnereticum]